MAEVNQDKNRAMTHKFEDYSAERLARQIIDILSRWTGNGLPEEGHDELLAALCQHMGERTDVGHCDMPHHLSVPVPNRTALTQARHAKEESCVGWRVCDIVPALGERTDRLLDSHWEAGAKIGWNYAESGKTHKEFAEMLMLRRLRHYPRGGR